MNKVLIYNLADNPIYLGGYIIARRTYDMPSISVLLLCCAIGAYI